MLESLLPLIGGGIFGAVIKLISLSMQMKNEEHKMLLETLKLQNGMIREVNEIANTNNGFAWTRRFIVIMITLIIAAAFFLPAFNPELAINIQQQVQTGGQFLFGLIDTTEVKQEWVKLQGSIILPEVGYTFQAIIGTYFGASIANRR